MDKKQRTFKIIRTTAIGLFMGFFTWLLFIGVGTLFDFGQSNSSLSNSSNMGFIGLLVGLFVGGTFIYINVRWTLKK